MTQNVDLNILIELKKGSLRVLNVKFSNAPIICEDGYRVIMSEPAYYLYIALSGHNCNEHPGIASPIYANTARAHIQANAWRNKGWGLAREVINQWGLHIRPWLGCFYLKDGKLVDDAPEYNILIDLATGQKIKPTAQYTVVERPSENRGGGRG